MIEENPTGLIAAEGSFPLIVAEKLSGKKIPVATIALDGITSPEIKNFSSRIIWLKLGQLKKARDFFKENNVKQFIMAGRIKHIEVLSLSPDLAAIRLLSGLPDKRAATILEAVCDFFEKNGISAITPSQLLGEFFAEKKVYTKKKPDSKILSDISLGFQISHSLSSLDVGQTVVIKDGIPVAIEAVEGTDACIRRAASLVGKGCVVVKAERAGGEKRFDVPVVGKKTVEVLCETNAKALAVRAGEVLFFDREESVKLADEKGIIIAGM